jgi:hypothetical protein
VTPDLQQRARVIAEAARDRLAQMRREERAKRPSNVVSGAIRASIKAMNPAQVGARFAEILRLNPTMQVAHRNLEHLSLDDMRSALEDAESLLEGGD